MNADKILKFLESRGSWTLQAGFNDDDQHRYIFDGPAGKIEHDTIEEAIVAYLELVKGL